MGTAAIVKTKAKPVKQSFLFCFHIGQASLAPDSVDRFDLVPVIHGEPITAIHRVIPWFEGRTDRSERR